MNKLKVVIDTNVFVRGWFFNDPECIAILDLVKKRKIYLGFSQDSIGELMYICKNFARKHIDKENDRLIVMNSIANLFYFGSSANTVGMGNIPNVVDKTDLMFVHCAIKYGADYLISNDFKSGMFNLDSSYNFNVVNTSDFLSLVKEAE